MSREPRGRVWAVLALVSAAVVMVSGPGWSWQAVAGALAVIACYLVFFVVENVW